MSQSSSHPHGRGLRAVKSFAADLPDEFLLCRELHHHWKPWTVAREGRSYIRVLRCSRCTTERHQKLSHRGEVLGTHYVHPEGYLREAGSGRITGEGLNLLRLESLNRTTKKGA